MARAGTTTVTSSATSIFDANDKFGSGSGTDGTPARAFRVRALSGSVDVRVPACTGTSYVTLSAAGQEIDFITTAGMAIGQVFAKGTSGSAKLSFAVTGV